jgi:Domain of unknown function (DUF4136)
MKRHFALLGSVAAILAGCAGGPNVRTSVDAAVDFGAFRTFGFVEQLGTDRGEYASLVTRALKATVTAEMEKRGYHPAENPDLLINFQGHSEDKQQAEGMVLGAGFHRGFGFGGRYGGDYSCWRDVRDVTQGTLNIDVVDRAKKVAVWEGTVVRELTDAEKKDLVKSLPALAAVVFQAYPYVAGQTAPVVPAKH